MAVTFDVNNCGEGIFAITAPMKEQIYLVCGTERALLIDTGMGIGHLKSVIDGLTNLPLTVVNTHGHPDHAGGNAEFPAAWLHPEDNALYEEMCSKEYRIADVRKISGKPVPELESVMLPFMSETRALSDAQEFDLGGRVLQVYRLQGHTKGSVMLYDSKTKSLFTGDSVSANETWLYDYYSEPLQTYYNSLKGFIENGLEISALYPGHLPSPIAPTQLYSMSLCVRNVLLRNGKGEPFETFAGSGLRYEYSGAKIIYNPAKLYKTDDGGT